MSADRATARGRKSAGGPGRTFTLQSAGDSLVLVRRIVGDVVRDYAELLRMRSEKEELMLANLSPPRLDELRRTIEAKVARLNSLHDELTEIGCQLKDWSIGLVDFPATLDGRIVSLCWQLGEERIGHWHETHEGFAGRREIAGAF